MSKPMLLQLVVTLLLLLFFLLLSSSPKAGTNNVRRGGIFIPTPVQAAFTQPPQPTTAAAAAAAASRRRQFKNRGVDIFHEYGTTLFVPLLSNVVLCPTTRHYYEITTSTTSLFFFPKTKKSNNNDSNLEDEVTTISTTNKNENNIQYDKFEHDNWSCAYRYIKKPKRQKQYTSTTPPILLIHPIGIGMSSWFWEPFMKEWNSESDIYAIDLIGCGSLGGDYWNPNERGLFLPLDYVKQCETFIQTIIKQPCFVICQGGNAPIGISLASRDSERLSSQRLIKNLIFTSPPTYNEMVNPIPEEKLEKNYNFYRGWKGSLAFRLLENARAIRLFSNLFLFFNKADDTFVQRATDECLSSEKLRPPIMAFNAGLMQHRSYERDLSQIDVPTLIVSGQGDDSRQMKRVGYTTTIPNCQLFTIEKS